MSKIIICMIVRQEAKIIKRCLTSCLPIADAICICDTGSTDDTVNIIEQFYTEHKLLSKVIKEPWKNFGHNREHSFKMCQKLARELSFDLTKSYALFIDADMLLEVKSDFNKNNLCEMGYKVNQRNNSIIYDNIRLACLAINWQCVGRTHEFWAGDRGKIIEELRNRQLKYDMFLKSLEFDDRNDGGCKADKFTRDIKFFEEDLIDDPKDVRAHFYMAQSYEGLGEWQTALMWYTKRIELGGWDEEVYMSKYRIGNMYKQLNKPKEMVHSYLDAYNYKPGRLEALHSLVKYYREQGYNKLAYEFGVWGLKTKAPESGLFIAYNIHNYELAYELAIVGYYNGDIGKQVGRKSIDQIAFRNDTGNIKDLNFNNSYHYALNKKINFSSITEIKYELSIDDSNQKYYHSNASITRSANGYTLIARTSNYYSDGYRYTIEDKNNIVRTRNYLVDLDKDLKITSAKEIKDNFERPRTGGNVLNMEDCRIVIANNKLYTTSCHKDISDDHIPKISFCELSAQAQVSKFTPQKVIANDKCEKNWLPFVPYPESTESKEDEIYILYHSHPVTVLKYDLTTSDYSIVSKKNNVPCFDKFRGSGSPIQFDGGYLYTIHEVVFEHEWEKSMTSEGEKSRVKNTFRKYMTRFVFMDRNFTIKTVSYPFTFMQARIEFTCGLCLDWEEKNILITFSVMDRNSYLAVLSVKEVKNLLHVPT